MRVRSLCGSQSHQETGQGRHRGRRKKVLKDVGELHHLAAIGFFLQSLLARVHAMTCSPGERRERREREDKRKEATGRPSLNVQKPFLRANQRAIFKIS